jgi:hypothetical protein
MADVSVNAANVLASSGAIIKRGVGGAASLTAGMAVYRDAADSNRLKGGVLTALASSQIVGILLCGGGIGQPLLYASEDDDFTPGFTMTVGVIYTLGGAPGTIAPSADVLTAEYPVVLYVPKSVTKAKLKISFGTVAV